MQWIKRWAVVLLIGGSIVSSCFAASLPWGTGGHVYYARKTPIAQVLSDFSNNFGVRLNLGAGVTGIVNGRISGGSPTEFLDLLTAAYGLKWFYTEGVLYVVAAMDWQTQVLSVSPATMPGLKQAMIDLHVLDERFGWAEISEQGLLLVSGPSDYVRIVTEKINALNLSPSGLRFAVFRLRYAKAADRTVSIRDTQVTIPGVVSILRNLATGMDRMVSSSAPVSGVATAMGSLSEPSNKPAAAAESSSASRKSGVSKPSDSDRHASIQGDTRLNAVIIKDSPEMIQAYEKLIATLDVPTRLVEIEAMIVDISKNHLKDLGVDWAVHPGGVFSATLGDTTTVPPVTAFTSSSTAPNLSGFATISMNRFLLRINALETSGDARVLGKPMILTEDNSMALIDMNQTFYTKLTGERVANLVPVTAGVMLKVVPRVITKPNGANEIQMDIDIEDGKLLNLTGITGLDLPVVQRSVISTQATIQERQSLLIAGFDSQEQNESVTGVPVLGEIPVLGFLFRNNSTKTTKTQRLFMITPRIVENGTSVVEASRSALPSAVPFMSAVPETLVPVVQQPMALPMMHPVAPHRQANTSVDISAAQVEVFKPTVTSVVSTTPVLKTTISTSPVVAALPSSPPVVLDAVSQAKFPAFEKTNFKAEAIEIDEEQPFPQMNTKEMSRPALHVGEEKPSPFSSPVSAQTQPPTGVSKPLVLRAKPATQADIHTQPRASRLSMEDAPSSQTLSDDDDTLLSDSEKQISAPVKRASAVTVTVTSMGAWDEEFSPGSD